MQKEFCGKKKIHEWLPFLGRDKVVPQPEEFGDVVTALVAGDRLPPIYPMGAL